MKFAVMLLTVLVLACAAGSFILQGQPYSYYAAVYSERIAALIIALRLDDVFHSWWFLLITAFLCLNLLGCNVIRFPQIAARFRREGDAAAFDPKNCTVSADVSDAAALFDRLHFRNRKESLDPEGRRVLFAAKGRAGLFGAFVCHIGVLLLILGFTLGQVTKAEYTVYGVPGQTKEIGDTGYYLTIDSFQVDRREDGSVRQYTSEITVTSPDGTVVSDDASVNGPGSVFGMAVYQNSTGWAETIRIDKSGTLLQQEVLCAGEMIEVSDLPGLVISFRGFYPDYVREQDSMPSTKSEELNNPATLYAVYYNENLIGMNVLMGEEPLTIDDYTVVFSEPQPYTLLQIKKDSFTWLALLGSIVTMLGLALAFYVQPQKVLAVEEASGWTVSGTSGKGGVLFAEKFMEEARALQRRSAD